LAVNDDFALVTANAEEHRDYDSTNERNTWEVYMKKCLLSTGLIAMASLLFLTACGGGGGNNNNDNNTTTVSAGSFTANIKEVTLGSEELSATFTLTGITPSNASVAVSASASASDVECSISGSGASRSVVCTPHKANSDGYTITVTATSDGKSATTTATLKAYPPELELATDTDEIITLLADETSATIDFTATKDWTIAETPAWMTVSLTDGHAGSNSITVTLTPNTDEADRTATIAINTKNNHLAISITQKKAYPPELELAADADEIITLFADETSATIDFTATKDWTVAETPAWMTVSLTDGHAGGNSITVTLTPNTDGVDRTATIAINTENNHLAIPITQKNVKTDGNEEIEVAGIVFVKVKAGSFIRGCDPAKIPGCNRMTEHNVTLTKDFYIAKYELTQAQWMAVMDGDNPSEITTFDGATNTNLPVTYVSWNNAHEFIKKLNGNLGYHTEEGLYDEIQFNEILKANGKVFHLPTDAQWEYAARGGVKSQGYIYSGYSPDPSLGGGPNPVGWYQGNSNDTTHPVGTLAANELGLYDMSGNVIEIVEDWWLEYTAGVDMTDPLYNVTNRYDRHTARNGGYDGLPGNQLILQRSFSPASTGVGKNRGFRLALTFSEEEPVTPASLITK
jgi:formylglycine-generating enzyme required for sulfatase activity